MVVRAPPLVSKGALESLNMAKMFWSRAGGASGLPMVSAVGFVTKPLPPKATGIFEVKAFSSASDHRHEMIASLATSSLKETPAATATTQSQTSVAPAGVERKQSVREAEAMTTLATSTFSSALVSAAKGKLPLRSG